MTRMARAAMGAMLAAAMAACTPSIGDKCSISTDCSVQGDRLCDTSQPDGYCTQFNCKGNTCPDKAACVLFNSEVPGCGYNDRSGRFGGRTARSFCMARCESNSDCRDGYVCASPLETAFGALILDNDQGQKTCLVKPIGYDQDAAVTPVVTDAGVCGPGTSGLTSPIDASAGTLDAGLPPLLESDAGADGG